MDAINVWMLDRLISSMKEVVAAAAAAAGNDSDNGRDSDCGSGRSRSSTVGGIKG